MEPWTRIPWRKGNQDLPAVDIQGYSQRTAAVRPVATSTVATCYYYSVVRHPYKNLGHASVVDCMLTLLLLLQNKVQAVLPRPRHPLLSQPGASDGNSPVSRRQQITLIFHLSDGLLSTAAAHEVRRAGVLTCVSCHLERSARPHQHRG